MEKIIKKFINIFTHERDIYVNAARVNDSYRKQSRGSTQKSMIKDLNLDYIIIYKRGSKSGEIANIDIDDFTSWSSVNVYVKLQQLSSNRQLYKAIKALRDVSEGQIIMESSNKDEEVINESDDEIEDKSGEEIINESDDEIEDKSGDRLKAADNEIIYDQPIIKLKKHERFRDSNDQPVKIEVRGQRTIDQIYFKANQVGDYFGLPTLVKLLVDDRNAFQVKYDYVFHECVTNALKKTPAKRIDRNTIYLTLAGFIKVVARSRSGNDNLVRAFDWIVNLVFVAKFGSDRERRELTRSLFNHTLNEETSGLYFIEIGYLNDLYDTMQISKETYPPETYGEYRIAKFRQAEHIPKRIVDHKSTTSGYGRWSKTVEYRWSVRLSPSQLNAAENMLSIMCKSEKINFDYTDPLKRKHLELVIYSPKQESKIRNMYKTLLNTYPSVENELAKQLSNAEDKLQAALTARDLRWSERLRKEITKRTDAEKRTLEVEKEIIVKDSEVMIITERMANMDIARQLEVTQLKLEMAEAKLHQ